MRARWISGTMQLPCRPHLGPPKETMPSDSAGPVGFASIVCFEPTPRGLLLTVLTVAAVWVALQLLPVALVLVAALFLVGTLNPAVEWLETKRWKRGWGIGFVFTVMFVFTVLVMALTIPSLMEQVSALAKEEPALQGRIVDVFSRSRATAPLAESLRNFHYEALARSSAGTALAYSARFFQILAYLVSAVFLALYIMVDRDRLRGGLFAVVPRSHHIRLSRVLLNLENIVGGYIRGQALTSVFMAVFTLSLLACCGVRDALAIAVFAGFADILPYIGVFLSVGPAVAAALSRGPAIAIGVLGAMLAYEEFESRFLIPRIYGRALRLPSSMVLVALLVGGSLMGIVGALLALPVAAATRMLIEELRVDLPGEAIDDDEVRARDEEGEKEYQRRAEGLSAEQAAAIAVAISDERRQEEDAAAAAPGDTERDKAS
jgi:predicted PurR-regulated permease PerM